MERGELAGAHRIVVKLGTGVVTHDGTELALGRLHSLIEDIVRLRSIGKEVLLVSSGAVGMGVRQLGLTERPRSLGLRQACAAVGQGKLIGVYTSAFELLGVQTAQVLVTADDLADRDRALCLRTTLMRLLELQVLPILNENDSVSVRELVEFGQGVEVSGQRPAFGDNDGLSARLAAAVDADALVLLTDVDGLFSADPASNPDAERIRDLDLVDDGVLAQTGGESPGGTGGMRSKLEAASLAAGAGIPTVIANGSTARGLDRIFAGEDIGTCVWPQTRRRARRRYIAVTARRGALVVNAGAIAALTSHKASLLHVGVLRVEGEFERGEVVEIRDESGRVHGRGVVNYEAGACRALAGKQSSEIGPTLGFRGYGTVVSRANLVLGDV